MATKKEDLTAQHATAEAIAAETPPDVEVVRTIKTEDGLRWHYEEEGGGVRTYVITKDGRALNVHHTSREAGRLHLRKFLETE